jgi:hypothetical protein
MPYTTFDHSSTTQEKYAAAKKQAQRKNDAVDTAKEAIQENRNIQKAMQKDLSVRTEGETGLTQWQKVERLEQLQKNKPTPDMDEYADYVYLTDKRHNGHQQLPEQVKEKQALEQVEQQLQGKLDNTTREKTQATQTAYNAAKEHAQQKGEDVSTAKQEEKASTKYREKMNTFPTDPITTEALQESGEQRREHLTTEIQEEKEAKEYMHTIESQEQGGKRGLKWGIGTALLGVVGIAIAAATGGLAAPLIVAAVGLVASAAAAKAGSTRDKQEVREKLTTPVAAPDQPEKSDSPSVSNLQAQKLGQDAGHKRGTKEQAKAKATGLAAGMEEKQSLKTGAALPAAAQGHTTSQSSSRG